MYEFLKCISHSHFKTKGTGSMMLLQSALLEHWRQVLACSCAVDGAGSHVQRVSIYVGICATTYHYVPRAAIITHR